MNLAIDIGNTVAKWALFDGRTLLRHGTGERPAADCTLVCASGELPDWSEGLQVLTAETTLPIKLDYKTPATLGTDRIAAACGAWGLHPGEPCLIVDAGTCITVDYLDASGVYHGGAIMPGLKMSLRALNNFTAKLPMVDIDGVNKAAVLGRSTEECIVAGTLGATMLALAGFVAVYKEKNPALHVLLTGGDADRLTRAGATGWEQEPMLTLRGLNEIMMNNEE